jgi:hypothetical protein
LGRFGGFRTPLVMVDDERRSLQDYDIIKVTFEVIFA